MIKRYLNDSIYSVDNFFKDDRWLYKIKINNYQLITIFWNLFLIFIPLIFALAIKRLWERTGLRTLWQKALALLFWFLWLLFIPNTAYVISEVRHLLDYCPIDSPFQVCEKNAWMVLFFFTYAIIGWISFVYLLNQMKDIIAQIFGSIASHLFTILIIPVIAMGFLMGLLHRWNSWEFFIYTSDFIKNTLSYFNDYMRFTNLLIFSIFLYILYYAGNYLFRKN